MEAAEAGVVAVGEAEDGKYSSVFAEKAMISVRIRHYWSFKLEPVHASEEMKSHTACASFCVR